MKKMYFAAVAVLLAVLIAGCSAFDEPPELEKPVLVYDENGQAVGVELGINIADAPGRALTKPLAQAGVNYYEVVFAHNPAGTGTPGSETFLRRSWRTGGQVRISVPFGTYDNTTPASPTDPTFKAYLFAGRYDTKTLLAVGVITLVTNNDSTSNTTGIISNITTSVTFTLTALQTDIGGLATPPLFTPTPPDTSTATLKWTQGGSVINNMNTTSVRMDDNPVPIAMFARSTPVTATYRILGINMATTHADSILVTGASTVDSTGFIYGEGDIPLATLDPASSVTNNTSGTVFNPDITLNLIPPNKDGLGIFYFQIPVMMYSTLHNPTNEPPAVQWYIRGGINNEIIDAGAAHNFGDGSIGGTILYGVGNVLEGSGFLIITQHQP